MSSAQPHFFILPLSFSLDNSSDLNTWLLLRCKVFLVDKRIFYQFYTFWRYSVPWYFKYGASATPNTHYKHFIFKTHIFFSSSASFTCKQVYGWWSMASTITSWFLVTLSYPSLLSSAWPEFLLSVRFLFLVLQLFFQYLL